MAKAKYYINVNSTTKLTNDKKMELLADFRNAIRSVEEKHSDAKIVIIRDVSDEDLMENLRGSDLNSFFGYDD